MEGFSDADRDVALGHVLGLRWFQLSTKKVNLPVANPDFMDLHRVTFNSPQFRVQQADLPVLRGARGIWEPGANTAQCLRSLHMMQPRRKDGGELYPEEHPVPVRTCLCGFWAYWHLGATQTSAPHIAGLVKGYGRIVQGPVGFRCETAEIVALVPLFYDQNAALALEAIYDVPVYGTIDALLEMHKAPSTQQPLADDYFHTARMAAEQRADRDQDQRGRRNIEPYIDYARRTGFLPNYSAPCMQCGAVACLDGQALCGPCQQAGTVQAQREVYEAEQKGLMLGTSAQDQLHARREGWAKMTPSILVPPTPAETEVIVRQKADTSGIKWALEAIKEKFGDGSWWRQQGPPQ